MKVVAYCIKSNEKILLAKANGKKHDITLISNALDMDTVNYAEGKDAVIICSNDIIQEFVISAFTSLGIKYILTRSMIQKNMVENALHTYGILLKSVCDDSPGSAPKKVKSTLERIYADTIHMLDQWQLNMDKFNVCD